MDYELHFKSSVLYAQLSNDGRFLYYAGYYVSVYDMLHKKTIQKMEKTRNSGVYLSHNGKILACPRFINSTKFEIDFFEVGDTLKEKFKVFLPEYFNAAKPCFTKDDHYFLFPGYHGKCKLWRIDCDTGICETIYQTEQPGSIIRSCQTSDVGILLSIYSNDGNVNEFNIILLSDDGKILKKVTFDAQEETLHVPFQAFLLKDSDVLILYPLRNQRTAVQIVNIKKTSVIQMDLNNNLIDGSSNCLESKISPNGEYLAWIISISCVIVYAIDGFRLIYKNDFSEYINNIFFSTDSKHLIVCEKTLHIITLNERLP